MSTPGVVGAELTLVIAVVASGGCAEQHRTTFDLQTPRIYVWTSFDHDYLRQMMEVQGLSVEEMQGEAEGLFLATGTGTLKWPSVEITVGENGVVANGISVESNATAYGNVMIYKDGRVVPHRFPPFER